MTDRELLEAAAKAAGLWDASEQCIDVPWNPLFDDGDALRLAVKLKLNIEQGEFSCGANDERDVDVSEFHNSDPYAATRRAIVRAAASMGGKSE